MTGSKQISASRHNRRLHAPALHVCLIVLLGLICYHNSLYVPFMFDDFAAIVVNPETTGGKSLWHFLLHGGSRRIADLSFALNYRLHDLQVVGYHVTNLAIHLTAAVVLYFLSVSLLDALNLRYQSDGADSGENSPFTARFIPVAASMLFVCHPLQTQAVTYIVQRYTSLATLFYLLALLAYINGRINLDLHGFTRRTPAWGLMLAVMSLLAFYTKQISYSIPLMIIMLEFALFRDRKFRSYLILAGVLLFLPIFLAAVPNGSIADVMFNLRHATSEDLYLSRSSYFLTQTRVIATYLRLLILPVQQNLDYDYPIFSSPLNTEVVASLVLHGILLATAFALYRRSHLQPVSADRRHDCYLRLISLGIAWFYIALIVESSFIPITDVIMEHRVYLPAAGFCIAMSALTSLISRKVQGAVLYRWLALAAVCLAFSTMTVARNRLWNDDLLFWQDAAEKSPRKSRVLSNLGWAYLNHDQFEIALRLFVNAIKLDLRADNHTWIMLNSSLKGLNYYQGRFTSGEEYLTPGGSVDLRWYSRFNSAKFNNMGLASEFVGQPEEAFRWYIQSLDINPDFDLAWFNLGLLSARMGHKKEGESALSKLTALNPALANKLTDYMRTGQSIH